MTGNGLQTWRPRWLVVVTILTGLGSFVFLVVTRTGDPWLVFGCLALVGIIPPLVALDVFTRMLPGRSTPPPSSPAPSSSPGSQGTSPGGGE